PDHQVQYLGDWVWNDVVLGAELTLPGKFDTQAALLQDLGYPESAVTQPGISLAPGLLDSEEEQISFRFIIDPDAATPQSTRSFTFYVAFASRRITLKALKYGFALRALPIDGRDPVGDPGSVYAGTYPYSRKIHVLTRHGAGPEAQAFVKFLLSPAGQGLVAA